jgi:hypothetical protein
MPTQDHGHPITPDQVLDRFFGMSDRAARLSIEAELGRKLPDDLEALMRQPALERYAHELRPVFHVDGAIDAIGLPKCVAPSGTPEKIRYGLGDAS